MMKLKLSTSMTGEDIYTEFAMDFTNKFSKICVPLCAITHIAEEFKHSITSLDEGMEFFGFDDYDDFYKKDYYHLSILDIGRQLADLYEDFYQSSKNFEKNLMIETI